MQPPTHTCCLNVVAFFSVLHTRKSNRVYVFQKANKQLKQNTIDVMIVFFNFFFYIIILYVTVCVFVKTRSKRREMKRTVHTHTIVVVVVGLLLLLLFFVCDLASISWAHSQQLAHTHKCVLFICLAVSFFFFFCSNFQQTWNT